MEKEPLEQILFEINSMKAEIKNMEKSLKNEISDLEKRLSTKIDALFIKTEADKNQVLNAINTTRKSIDTLTDRRFEEHENRISNLEQSNK
jgi:hypothetical protein